MRRLKLHFNIDSPVLEAFVFFALALDEKLYDLTDDSFKAAALNTYTRTLELQGIAHANYVAGIGKDALKPFIEELEWSISRDAALSPDQHALCKAQIENISSRVGESAQISRAVAGLRLVFGDYFQSIESAIRKIITSDQKRKSDLLELASSFVIQAELEGFPRRHTYHITRKLLISPLKYERKIDPIAILNSFFEAFKPVQREFDCLFLAEEAISKHSELLDPFGLSFRAEAPTWENLGKNQQLFLASRKSDQVWILAEEVSGRSAAEAHEKVFARFDAVTSVLRFFEHKSDIQLSRLSLVRDRETKLAYMSHEALDPMHCWIGNLKFGEADFLELSDAIHGGHLVDDSAVRLARALRFHKAALLSNSAENQLIDLWAALEGLLPSPKRESLRIEYFAESILPALTLTYPEKLFSSAYRDTLKVIAEIQPLLASMACSGSEFARFVNLLLCDEFEAERKSMLEMLDFNPLLRNKLWRLADIFKSRAAVQTTLRAHRRKVKWHLSRIYFTRNSIMHSATSMPYLATLVENLHLYVDTLVRVISKVAHKSREKLSIEAALQYLSAWEKVRIETLTQEGKDNLGAPKPDDVWPLVFGRDMLLAPDINNDLAVQD